MTAKPQKYKRGEPRRPVGVRFPQPVIDRMDRLRQRTGQSQSDFLIDLINKAR